MCAGLPVSFCVVFHWLPAGAGAGAALDDLRRQHHHRHRRHLLWPATMRSSFVAPFQVVRIPVRIRNTGP